MEANHQKNHRTAERRAKIDALKKPVVHMAGPGEEEQTAQGPPKSQNDEEAPWRVDWNAVSETEAWLRSEWAAGRTAYDGPPRAYDILPSAVPEEVGQIGGVLLARCAGYAVAPRPTEVAAAVKANTPTEREWYALETYLLEATATEVRAACLAGEIELRKLMRCVETMIEKDESYGLRSVEQWLTR